VVIGRDGVYLVANLGAVERSVADDSFRSLLHGWGSVGCWPVVGSTVDPDAFVSFQVPHADSPVSGAGDGLVLVKLAAVDAICVTIQVNGSGCTGLPSPVDCAPRPEHLLPVLGWCWVAACHLASAQAAHLDRRRGDVYFGFVFAEEDVPPDVR